jgi:hypothetical protein
VSTALTTKEGVRVEVGQVWRDLDKRMHGRTRRVEAIVDAVLGKVRLVAVTGRGRFPTVVSVRRMHKSSTGWALVQPSKTVLEFEGEQHEMRAGSSAAIAPEQK